MKFSRWLEARSQKDELKCPHPEDKEYCHKWNLWMKGEIASMPVHKGRNSIGHYTGPRAGEIPHKRKKQRSGGNKKGGRYDWRKQLD